MIGKKVGGRYEILDRVGGGGMAVVYKAKDVWLDRIVALKVLRPQFAIDDDFVQRFRREAQAAASLSHPNIVSIYDVGIEEEIHYIVMEYVEGTTLKEFITSHAPLPADEAVHITKQIAEALEHAHHNQIIHRDIKPHNILMGKNNRVKVTDFGIARAVTSATITHTGSVIGSVHYFSPEQARGGITGEKSDIYSLGIVLYEMLTGKLPFAGDSPISVALKHLQEPYTEPKQLNASIPQSVENIIIRSLAKDPMYRYTSARELIEDLDTCLDAARLTERKLMIDNELDDDEMTKVIPAISEDMFETKVVPNKKLVEPDEDEDEEDEEEDERQPRRKKSIWLKVGIIFMIIFLLGFGLYLGANAMLNLFYVPEIAVEDVTGLHIDEAVQILEEQGFRVDASQTTNHSEIEADHVVSQSPSSPTKAKEASYIRLVVSEGKEKVRMRSVVNMNETNAERLLQNFREIEVIEEENNTVPAGHVIRHEPDVNEMVVPDETKVTLYVSKGKAKFEMPKLIGMPVEAAKAELERKRLVLDGEPEFDFSDLPEGQVFRQHPVDPGVEVEAGTPIKIWVSKGYKEVYQERTYPVEIQLNEGEIANVTIWVSDVNGEDRKVVEEHINVSKQYNLDVKVSRDKHGTIKVYKNGQLYEGPIRIDFEE